MNFIKIASLKHNDTIYPYIPIFLCTYSFIPILQLFFFTQYTELCEKIYRITQTRDTASATLIYSKSSIVGPLAGLPAAVIPNWGFAALSTLLCLLEWCLIVYSKSLERSKGQKAVKKKKKKM